MTPEIKESVQFLADSLCLALDLIEAEGDPASNEVLAEIRKVFERHRVALTSAGLLQAPVEPQQEPQQPEDISMPPATREDLFAQGTPE